MKVYLVWEHIRYEGSILYDIHMHKEAAHKQRDEIEAESIASYGQSRSDSTFVVEEHEVKGAASSGKQESRAECRKEMFENYARSISADECTEPLPKENHSD